VTTLVAGGGERAARRAGELGLAWGLGHAATLFTFGLPILLLDNFLPHRAEQAVETVIGCVIALLGLRLLIRWRRGELGFHPHPRSGRTRRGAFTIGLVHGVGGSTGVGVLVLASVRSTGLAVISLALLAVLTAVSMTLLSSGFGSMLASRPARTSPSAVAPALGTASLIFGIWYAAAAWSLAPYPF
jgi:hypothetical protein